MADFTAQIHSFIDRANRNIDTLIKKTVFELGEKVVMRSPVGDDTYWQHPAPPGYVGGRFRANWQYGNSTAPSGSLDNIDPSGAETISRLRSQVNASTAQSVHYIVNNLPYAEKIENGHSWHQAPAGVVAVSIAEFPILVADIARSINP